MQVMKTLKKWQLLGLFISGVFFGGALDHIIFAMKGSGISHYGYKIGINGNWLMSLLDLSITCLLVWLAFRKSKKNHA
jgi:hypothetical protein